jgi:hypothetical protein
MNLAPQAASWCMPRFGRVSRFKPDQARKSGFVHGNSQRAAILLEANDPVLLYARDGIEGAKNRIRIGSTPPISGGFILKSQSLFFIRLIELHDLPGNYKYDAFADVCHPVSQAFHVVCSPNQVICAIDLHRVGDHNI